MAWPVSTAAMERESRRRTWVIVAGVAAFVVGLLAMAAALFYPAIFLIGPHSDVLPTVLQTPAVILILALCLAVAFLVARRVYRRLYGGSPER